MSIDGEVRGWGGRYCDDTACLEPFETEAVPLPTAAQEVHGNGDFTVARLDDGTVMGWGPQPSPDQEETESLLPIGFGGAAAELALGVDFLCARLEDGAVECRGLPDRVEPAWLPDMPSVTDALEVTAGAEHACARRATGDVICWGNDDAAQLGPGAAGTLTVSGSVEQIVAGGQHTCALLVDGTVECWGSNAKGQLGRPTEAEGTVVAVPLPEPVGMLAMGAQHGCAIGTNSGSLYCWGSNEQGQLGAGGVDYGGPLRVELGGHRVVAVFAGATARTTFALLETGGLRGWGLDDDGQTGYGDRFSDDDVSPGDLPDIIVYIPPDEPEPDEPDEPA